MENIDLQLVSIIIPVYNSEKYLAECVESALGQTWCNKEIIIVDDGSTDGSLDVANKYAIYPNVKIICQNNKGAAAARNTGLRQAKGEFIQFLDADDLLSAGKISVQLKSLLQHPGKVAVCSTVHFFSDQNPYEGFPSSYEDSFLYETDDPIEFLINLYGGNNNGGSMIQTNALLTPASVIKKAGYWSEFYSPDDDGEFFCRVLLSSNGIIYVKKCYNYYRKHQDGNSLASSKTKEALHGKFKSFLLKKENLLNAANNIKTKKALAHSAMELAVMAYPTDKKLTSEILKNIKNLGGTDYVPVLGGAGIELIKRVFGWKLARKLQYNKASIHR